MDLSYSLDKVNNILKDFYNITNFRIALFDENFSELLAYPSRLSDFCKIIRTDDILHEICLSCDFNGFCRCKNSNEPIIYECHMGLTEILVPVVSSEITIGYLMCGQIKTPKSNPVFDKKFSELSQLCNETQKELLSSYENYPTTPSNIIGSVLNFLQILTSYLLTSHALSINSNSLAYKIDQYIIDNITDPLDVSTLCNHFHYQKTNFYKITSSFYGTSIMKHIRHIRIQHAKDLLASTSYSISEVSEMVGIDDYNYFTKLFKKETNCTPREYRRNNISLLSKNITQTKI